MGALWYSSDDPYMATYLDPVIEEINELYEKGMHTCGMFVKTVIMPEILAVIKFGGLAPNQSFRILAEFKFGCS